MSWEEYKKFLKEDWEFHKRHPEMFLVLGAILTIACFCALK